MSHILYQLKRHVEMAEPFYRLSRLTQSDRGNIHRISGGEGTAGVSWKNLHELAELIAVPTDEVIAIRVDNGSAAWECHEVLYHFVRAIDCMCETREDRNGRSGFISMSSIESEGVRFARQKFDRHLLIATKFFGYYASPMLAVAAGHNEDLFDLGRLIHDIRDYKPVLARLMAAEAVPDEGGFY